MCRHVCVECHVYHLSLRIQKCNLKSVCTCLCIQIVPEIIAMAFSILWLSRIRAGVRRLSHTTFIYYTERQTGGELGYNDAQERLTLEANSPLKESNSFV